MTTDKINFDLRRLMAADLDARSRWKIAAQIILDRSGADRLAEESAHLVVLYHSLVIDRQLTAIFCGQQSADQREIEARTALTTWEQELRQAVSDERRAGSVKTDAPVKAAQLAFPRG